MNVIMEVQNNKIQSFEYRLLGVSYDEHKNMIFFLYHREDKEKYNNIKISYFLINNC